MFESFTDRARKSLLLAQQAAPGMGHGFVGCEHILLGLVEEGSGVAAVVLRDRGIDGAVVRSEIAERVGVQDPSPVTDADALASLGIDLAEVHRHLEASFGKAGLPPSPDTPAFTPRARAALERAVAESDLLQHGYVGTEHLLLGVLGVDGNAGRAILEDRGIDFVALRHSILELAAADYLRLVDARRRHQALFQLLFDPDTKASIEPIYNSMSASLAAAHRTRAMAMRTLTQEFADASTAAIDAAEAAAVEAGLLERA